jgi:hypothetical protein
MTSDIITQSFELPFGYTATFRWSHDKGWNVDWEPDVPNIRKERAFRKFHRAYQAARHAFLTDVAASIGGNVLVADIGNPAYEAFEVIKAPSKH